VAVFANETWAVAARNRLVGIAHIHVVHSEVKEGIVDVLFGWKITEKLGRRAKHLK
jgi:hypothetical protein